MPGIENMSPEQRQEALQQLEQAGEDRNRVSVGEFERFKPLFEQQAETSFDGRIQDEQLAQLQVEFQNRFNLYAPIFITEDDSPNSRVVETLPPQLTPTRTVNELDSDGQTNARFNRFASTMTREEHPLRTDHEMAAHETRGVLRNLGDEEAAEKQVRLWEDAVGPQEDDDNGEISDDDFDWDD